MGWEEMKYRLDEFIIQLVIKKHFFVIKNKM